MFIEYKRSGQSQCRCSQLAFLPRHCLSSKNRHHTPTWSRRRLGASLLIQFSLETTIGVIYAKYPASSDQRLIYPGRWILLRCNASYFYNRILLISRFSSGKRLSICSTSIYLTHGRLRQTLVHSLFTISTSSIPSRASTSFTQDD